jgi:hypothetical protein
VDDRYALWAAAGAGGVLLVLLIVVITLWVKLRRVRAAQTVLLADGSEGGLIEHQAALNRAMERQVDRLDGLAAEIRALRDYTEQGLRDALRFQGLVRYDAYGDIGGAQSWSMAILNADRTGAIITSLHARDHARVYLKQMDDGVPSHRLSPEEERAVEMAMGDPVASFVGTPQ